MADVLDRGDREVAVRGLDLLEDRQHLARVVVAPFQDLLDRDQIDRLEVDEGLIGHRPSRAPQGGFLAPLAERLGRAPVGVEAVLRVVAAHVDAFDRASLRALEAGLALEVAKLVVEELEPSAEANRDVRGRFGVLDGGLRLEEAAQRQRHPLCDAQAWNEAHRALTG